MNKKHLLRKIWEEKRGRPAIKEVYPLGILICIDDKFRSLNEIGVGILELLSRDPAKGLDWAIHWGRTIVQVHPKVGYGMQFTMRKDAWEKLGVMVSTEKNYQLLDLISENANVGRYTIVLNNQPMLYEGAILAIERMIDELVWCKYQELLLAGNQTGPESYKSAVVRVMEEGFSIRAESEDWILDLKVREPETPVRIYGKMYWDVKIPTVIGAILDEGTAAVRPIRVPESKDEHPVRSELEMRAPSKFTREDLICVSLTSAKPLHFGHVLHFVTAENMRRALGANTPLVFESNDVGERIIRMVAKLSEACSKQPKEIVTMLSAGLIDQERIHAAYRQRDTAPQTLQAIARQELSARREPLLPSVEAEIQSMLQQFGISTKIVRDSECLEVFEDCFGKNGFLGSSGFQVTKYSTSNSSSMIVLKKKGVPSAAAMRAGFFRRVNLLYPQARQVVFADSDNSVKCGTRLVYLGRKSLDADFFEGAGLSLGFEPGSGTKGNLPTASEIRQFLDAREVSRSERFGVITYFSLTRPLTARGHKQQPLAKGSMLGQSFYDYASVEDLYADLEKCIREYRSFIRRLGEAASRLGSLVGTTDPWPESDKVRLLLLKLSGDRTGWIDKTVACRPVNLGDGARAFRELVHQLNRNVDPVKLDEAFAASFLPDGVRTSYAAEKIRSMGFRASPLAGDPVISCVFSESLIMRGYSEARVREYTGDYLSGRRILAMRRMFAMQVIEEAQECSPLVRTGMAAERISSRISCYCQQLGFV